MVVVDALHNGDTAAAAAADELFGGGAGYADLQAIFDHKALEVKTSGYGSNDEEELEWLSNKDAFPTVETMDWAGARPRTKGVRQSRLVVAWSAAEGRQCRHCRTESTPQWRDGPMGRGTLCNACGIRYRTGRLLPEYRPEKSPTFSSKLHSNSHRRVVELHRRREEAVQTSLAAAGYGKKGGLELERQSKKSVFRAVETMAPAGQRPRTKGLQRPRRVLPWSPPPPLQTPAPAGWWRSGGVGAGGAIQIQHGRVPVGGDGGADGNEGRAAAPTGGGVDATMPRALAVAGQLRSPGGRDGMAVKSRRAAALQAPASAVARRRCQHCGTDDTPQWREGPEGAATLCNACGIRYRSGRLVPEYRPARSPTFSPALHSNMHRRIVQRLRAAPVITTAIAIRQGEEGGVLDD